MSFSCISGTVLYYDANTSTADVMTPSGIGYPVVVSGVGQGDQVELFTISSHDTNGVLQRTYGYSDVRKREIHRAISSIRGVGHVVASAIASMDGSPEALATGDMEFLCGIRGVGKKGAENILAEYRKHPERFPAAAIHVGSDALDIPDIPGPYLESMKKIVSDISGNKNGLEIRKVLTTLYNEGYRNGELIANAVRSLSSM